MARRKLTKHHVIPRSQGGCNKKHNIVMLPEKEHREYHARYVNMHPHDIIRHLEKKVAKLERRLACMSDSSSENKSSS